MSRDTGELVQPIEDNPDWVYGVVFGATLWVAGTVAVAVDSGLPADLIGFMLVIGWVVLPVAIYFDATYVGANGDWQPMAILWALGGLLPLGNVIVALAYLHRRYQAIGLPGVPQWGM